MASKIKEIELIDGSIYEIGSSSVVANPPESSTADLTSIQIDDTVYAVKGGSGSASELSELSDVTISSPSAGQVLVYDSNSEQWINKKTGIEVSVEESDDNILVFSDGSEVETEESSKKIDKIKMPDGSVWEVAGSGSGVDAKVENGVLKFVNSETPKSDTNIIVPNLVNCNKNGIAIEGSSASFPFTAYMYEYSSGHEGITIPFIGFEVNTNYTMTFDFKNRDVAYLGNTYSLGYVITQNQITSWITDETGDNRYNNIQRNNELQHFTETFKAVNDIMFLVLYCNGYSDSRNNYFTISNLKIKKVEE